MKKVISYLLAVTLLFNILNPVSAKATETTTTIEYLNNGDYIETILVVESDYSQPYATTQTKKGTKTSYYKNSDDTVLWSVSVTGTFSYISGSSSTCTAVSGSAVTNDSSWKVSTASTSKSGNKAISSTTAKHYTLFIVTKTVEKSVTLTCDTYGNLS